ncbi:MAG TPA: hypothetical protein VLH09_13750 [Bryobacteraceae bacterium]|nr:hypothetical protein [Bryobacteraceae bacterium]
MIRRFDREPVTGFVNPRTYLLPEGVEVMTQGGSVSVLPYAEIKLVCFVRDFSNSAAEAGSRIFQARPKTEGLWVRMRFLDDDQMDGLLVNNLLQLERYGFSVVPPNPSASNQRLFVPKTALREFLVLAVVGSPLHPGRRKPPSKDQIEMFE